MSADTNRYLADLRELSFVLFEQFRFGEVAGAPPFEAWGVEEAKAVLGETYRLAREVLGPLNASGDREGCRLEGGSVVTPKGFKEAWAALYQGGFPSVSVNPDHGGQGAPVMLHALVQELLSGANVAFHMYSGLAYGAGELLAQCGTPEQVHRYAEKIFNGTWGGTMCLTEPQAGSDVGAAQCSARKQPDGSYRIRGTKIFISAGDHDLTENIIHLVLARIEGAPPGTKGLSLFIVPKRALKPDGTPGDSNDVQVASIEHKMGINGSATCVLNFGDEDRCAGELVGGVEHAGMAQMFKMMNSARIAVGVQGLATASTAYLNALVYARERKQGAPYQAWKDPTQPRAAIVEHPDVRRMLLEMKSHVEGIRALVMKLARHQDLARALEAKQDPQAMYHHGQVELLTPLIKAYATDEGFRLCAQAIQVFGGAGYLKDHPVEQYARDAKIFSIYEGTNHIQAQDLVGRKLAQANGAYLGQFLADVEKFARAHRLHPVYGPEVERLDRAREAVARAVAGLLRWSQTGKLHLVLLGANRFLKMMSELAVGWLLLEAGVVADQAASSLSEAHPDRAFYAGKRASALWYARNVLPQVELSAEVLALEDASAMEIPEQSFAAS